MHKIIPSGDNQTGLSIKVYMKKYQIIRKTFICLLLSMFFYHRIMAQQTVVDSSLLDRVTELEKQVSNSKPGEEHFLLAGVATVGFASAKSTNSLNGSSPASRMNSFPDADNFEFSPMFIWRHGDEFLLEFEPSFNNNGLSVNWADISWFAAPNLIIRAGYFVLPFGTYAKREAAGWINKLAPDPIGIADMTPTDYGIEVEGGLPIGNMKMNYDVALTNGNQLNADGTLTSGNIVDNNNNKTVTARLGLLPFSNSSLEIGVSGMFGTVGDQGTAAQNTKGNMYAFDLNYVKTFSPILVNIKSQYNFQDIGKADYLNPADSSKTYTFTNQTTAFFAQCSLRPVGANNLLKNIELAGRYTVYNTPSNSTFGMNQHSTTIGLAYWLSWRTVFKLSYDIYTGNSTASQNLDAFTGTTKTDVLYVQFSIQL
jgi:hypothetical protein